MEHLTSTAYAFLGVAIMEVFVKPLAISLTQALFPRGVAEAMQLADKLIPQLLKEGEGGEALEYKLREFMAHKTGDSRWHTANMKTFWSRYSTKILLDSNQKSHHE
jgi:hypothetical protein